MRAPLPCPLPRPCPPPPPAAIRPALQGRSPALVLRVLEPSFAPPARLERQPKRGGHIALRIGRQHRNVPAFVLRRRRNAPLGAHANIRRYADVGQRPALRDELRADRGIPVAQLHAGVRRKPVGSPEL